MKKLFRLYSLLLLLSVYGLSQTTNTLQTVGQVKTTGSVATGVESNSSSTSTNPAALPDSDFLNWDTSTRGTPNLVGSGGRLICVGTISNPSALPIPCNVSLSFPSPTFTNLIAALGSTNCGDWVILQNTQYGSNNVATPILPTNRLCPANQYIWVTRDITDTHFPAEGFRNDPCYIGIPQSVMPWHRYPSWDVSPNNCARHMPQIMTQGTALGGGSNFSFNQGFNIGSISSFRFLGIEITTDSSRDIRTSMMQLNYLPPIDCALDAAVNTFTVGVVNGLSVGAGGTGYVVGDVLNITGGDNNATVTVSTVSSGVITGVTNKANGTGYTIANNYATTKGTGTGAKINITSLTGTGGTGYQVGDVVNISGGGVTAKLNVATVSSGAITSYTINDPGQGYSVANNIAITGGHGTGGQVNITGNNGANALPIHADFCFNDQPQRIICDRCIIHGDAQRQTASGISPNGTRWFALLDSDIYDIGETYAGGGGDASGIPMGTGHGFTGEGRYKIANNYISASTESATIAGGAFTEPKSPLTGFDGNVRNVWFIQNWVNKNIMWNTQRGQAGNRTLTVDGLSYPPVGPIELVVAPHTLQLQTGQSYEINYTLYNYSGQGIDRDVNTVLVDGVSKGNATTGIIVTNGEHTIYSGKWQPQNMVTYTYTAPSTPGTHIIQLNSVTQNNTPGSSFGNNLTVSDSMTVTVVSTTPTKQMVLHPKLPDLQIQPSYSDTFFNTRQFCFILINAPNYTPVSFTYTVDGIANGNSSVGTIDTTGPAYCSGTQTGIHTIKSTSAGGTSDSITVNVSTTAPITDFDLKAFTSKNLIEFKEGCQILVQYNFFENAWGSNGNGGGQMGEDFLAQVLNQPLQILDGSGINKGWGPQTTCDVNFDHNYFLHSGHGVTLFVINSTGAGYDLGLHRVTISNNIIDDISLFHNSNGWLTSTVPLEIGGTSGTKVLDWTSLANPLSDNITITHNDFIGPDYPNTIDITNNIAQFPIGGVFNITDNIFSSPNQYTFVNLFGEANDCDQANKTVQNNTLAKAIYGTGFTPAKPCAQNINVNYNLFLDSTSCTGLNTPVSGCPGDAFAPATHMFRSASTASNLFKNVNGQNGGDYTLVPGSPYLTAADDGTYLGADTVGVYTGVNDAILGIRIPPGIITPSTTLGAETANNSSSCSTSVLPTYCNIPLPDFQTASGNTGAQTVHLAPKGHISPMTLNTYLYPGATTRWIAAYQPWFNTGNCVTSNYSTSSGHPCVGYNENTSAVVFAQHSLMLSEGFTDVSPDWYGNSGNSDSTFINNTVIAQAADLSARCSGTCPLHLMVMVDGGLIANGMVGAAGCPKSNSIDETTCITTVLNKAYDYIDANWGRQNYYSTDPSSGQPITLTFITKSDWAVSNWATIWTNVKTHMAGYATPYKVIEEYGSFTDTAIDGAYGWPQSEAFTSGNQFCWQGGSCSFDYFNNLYTTAQANPSKILVGEMWPGFDGSNNNYNHTVTARQCGQLLYLQTQKTWVTGTGFTLYSSSNQLPWMLVPTWNDYGEGTNIENGVDNCYTLTANLSGTSTLSWSLNPSDTTYASTTTIDHFIIWYEDSAGNLYKALDNVPVTSLTTNIGSLIPQGSWTVFVEMVGKPLILNRMSNGIAFTH